MTLLTLFLLLKVAQRQQQQRLLQQQLTGVVQPAAPGATPATILIKAPVNSKSQKPAIATIPARKIQRLNGAKVIVTNNCDKVRTKTIDNFTYIQITFTHQIFLSNRLLKTC